MRFALETALFVVIVVAFPVWGTFQTRRLRANASDVDARTGGYIETLVGLWVAAAAAIALRGWNLLFTAPIRPAWLPSTVDLLPIAIGGFLGLAIPLVLLRMRRSREGSANVFTRQIEGLAWFLPVTPTQRWLWVAVSISAGICEELLFRGFAMRYLMQEPLALTVVPAIIVASVAFGINHAYQGIAGILGTTILGAVFALLFLITGNLAAVIVVHALIDLRVLLLPKPAAGRT